MSISRLKSAQSHSVTKSDKQKHNIARYATLSAESLGKAQKNNVRQQPYTRPCEPTQRHHRQRHMRERASEGDGNAPTFNADARALAPAIIY